MSSFGGDHPRKLSREEGGMFNNSGGRSWFHTRNVGPRGNCDADNSFALKGFLSLKGEAFWFSVVGGKVRCQSRSNYQLSRKEGSSKRNFCSLVQTLAREKNGEDMPKNRFLRIDLFGSLFVGKILNYLWEKIRTHIGG